MSIIHVRLLLMMLIMILLQEIVLSATVTIHGGTLLVGMAIFLLVVSVIKKPHIGLVLVRTIMRSKYTRRRTAY